MTKGDLFFGPVLIGFGLGFLLIANDLARSNPIRGMFPKRESTVVLIARGINIVGGMLMVAIGTVVTVTQPFEAPPGKDEVTPLTVVILAGVGALGILLRSFPASYDGLFSWTERILPQGLRRSQSERATELRFTGILCIFGGGVGAVAGVVALIS